MNGFTQEDIQNLRDLWENYHRQVHKRMDIPCDGNPGEDCSVDAFLYWLETGKVQSIKENKQDA